MIKEGLTVKVSTEGKLRGSQGMSYEYSRGNRLCKGPEAGTGLVCEAVRVAEPG